MFTYSPSPITPLQSAHLRKHQVQVLIKRDDLLQPAGDQRLCGNKVRKLKYNLEAARAEGFKRLLTFGGAYSNHIAALARAGQVYGFQTVGVIRGEAHHPLNPTLAQAVADGMQLHYLDRQSYRQKDHPEIHQRLRETFGDYFFLPEGGTNALALKGCAEMIPEIALQLNGLPDYIALACGTGGTIAGLIQGCRGRSHLIGVSALKGNFMQAEVQKLLKGNNPPANWEIFFQYHFGGYAKFPTALQTFVRELEREHQITLDPIYTAKLFYGIIDQIQKGFFPKGTRLLLIHSGGLQGWNGFKNKSYRRNH